MDVSYFDVDLCTWDKVTRILCSVALISVHSCVGGNDNCIS